MAVPQYGIDVFNFEFWRGPPPTRVQDHGRVFTKPGSNNIGLQTTGIFGEAFDVELESWWPPDGSADAAMTLFAALPWSGWLAMKFNGINYTASYGLGYHALHVTPVRVKRAPLLRRAGVGGVTYSPGDRNISRWTLQPELLT